MPNLISCLLSVSLKRPSVSKEEVRAIDRVREKVAEEDRFHKTLLNFRNLFKAGLITEAEFSRRQAEEEKNKESK